MRIAWGKNAVQDLYHIREYIRLDNPGAAQKVGARIESAVAHLAKYPEMAPPGRRPKTRELLLPDFPYRIVYRIQGGDIQILRIFHTRRKWPLPL